MLPQAPYHRYRHYLQNKFGCRIRKISIDAGFTCPNRDGTTGSAGCTYCNNDAFSPGREHTRQTVAEQIENALRKMRPQYPGTRFLAYFQPFSNTYAPVDELEKLYAQAMTFSDIVGLAIGTRPDCLDEDKVELLAGLAERKYLQMEIGLQTANNATLARIKRGHTLQDFCDAMRLCRNRGMDLCGHMIVGLPGETGEDALRTAAAMVKAGITGIKIHNLHIVRGTHMAAEFAASPFHLLSMQEHVRIVCDIIERLPWEITVQRLAGTAPKKWLIAPEWCGNPSRVIAAVENEFKRRGSAQGIFSRK